MSTRSDFLAAGAVTALVLGASATPASAADATILDEAAFRAHSASTAKHRQAIGAARINDGSVFQFVVNTLNGFTTWKEPAANVQIAVVLYGSASTLALDDAAWSAHHLAEIVKRVPGEWLTADGSQSNPYAHPPAGANPSADKSIPTLLQRGVRIYVCNTALGDVANRIVAAGTTAGAGNDAFAVQAHLRERVLPGIAIVPAGISSMSVLQSTGYTYFSAAL